MRPSGNTRQLSVLSCGTPTARYGLTTSFASMETRAALKGPVGSPGNPGRGQSLTRDGLTLGTRDDDQRPTAFRAAVALGLLAGPESTRRSVHAVSATAPMRSQRSVRTVTGEPRFRARPGATEWPVADGILGIRPRQAHGALGVGERRSWPCLSLKPWAWEAAWLRFSVSDAVTGPALSAARAG